MVCRSGRTLLRYIAGTATLTWAGLGAARPLAAQDTRDIVGYVLAVQDSMPLLGVTVQLWGMPLATVTDTSGFFALRRLPSTDHLLVFARLGVTTDSLRVPVGTDTVRVYLQSRAVQLAPVIASAVPAARVRFQESAQASAVTIDQEDIKATPSLLEADVIRTIQLLPGTIAVNDYTVGYNARGGEADQNLIQLDGITIFNPSHLGGLFSTFDASAVGDVEYMTGGFPSSYSGRLSSVLDVRSRPGRRQLGLSGQVSLLSSKLLVEGPLPLESSSFLLAGRRTYADRVVDWFSSSELPYYFADGIGKLSFLLPSGGTLSATGYWGRDDLNWEFAQTTPDVEPLTLTVNWGNRLVGLQLDELVFGKPLTVRSSATEFSTTVGFVPDVVQVDNDVRLLSADFDLALSPGATHDVRIGGGVEDYTMDYDFRSVTLGATFWDQTYRPRVWAAFVDDQWDVTPWLMLRPGVRLEVVDGAEATTWAPRIAAKAFVTRDFALTGSVGRYHQPIHSLRDHNTPWSFLDFWIGADSVTPVGRSDHIVLGFERWWRSGVSLSVEGYRKTFTNVLNFNIADDFRVQGDEFLLTKGDAWGLDLLLRKYSGRWTGWISYSFTKAVRRDITQEYAPAHDRRHLLNLVINGPGPFGSRMSARWGYGSPLPYTEILGEWSHRQYIVGANGFGEFEDEPIADPLLNRARYPHYSRLDVSFRWETGFFGGVLRPFLQFVNVYNRGNIFLYVFDYTGSPGTRQGISQLPFLPSFGAEFEF